MYIMLFEFQYNYKIPTSGEYISDRRRTNPDLYAGGGEWGLTLIGVGLCQICQHNLKHNRLTCYAGIMPAFWAGINRNF